VLRIGLTGGLGSGKSTVAHMLASLGAHVLEADEQGRTLMQPGQPVYAEIVRVFGPAVVVADGTLDRKRLAELAFTQGRLQDLNAIVHPAVIEAQRQWSRQVFAQDPAAVTVVVSALIFEVERDARTRGESDNVLADWRRRIDRVIVVTAPEDLRIARYLARLGVAPENRAAAEADARARIAHQVPDALKVARADYVLENSGDEVALATQVRALWSRLQAESNKHTEDGFLQ
jgi:dephospho-CoA kinase